MKQEISILNKLSQMPLYHVILTHVVQTPQGKTLPKSEAVPRARVIRNKRQLSIKQLKHLKERETPRCWHQPGSTTYLFPICSLPTCLVLFFFFLFLDFYWVLLKSWFWLMKVSQKIIYKKINRKIYVGLHLVPNCLPSCFYQLTVFLKFQSFLLT